MFAIWLNVLIPLALHSTAPFVPPTLLTVASDSADDDDDGCALQHDHDADASQAQDADHHEHHACAVCQALHFAGGALGPAHNVLLASIQLAWFLALYAIPVSAAYEAAPARAGHARAPPAPLT